jgi:hypothetical protein
MIKMSKIIFLGVLIFFVTACMELTHDPLPQNYIQWFKPNASREETKQATQECSLNVSLGYVGEKKVEECMLKKGFQLKDNLKDPHSLKNTDKIAAKISASKTHINRF